MKRTNILTLAEHQRLISQRFSQRIQEHTVLRKINDCLFERTTIYFNTLLLVLVFGYFLPLLYQIFYFEDTRSVILCNWSCLVVTIFFQA